MSSNCGCSCKDGERGPMGPQGLQGDKGDTGPAGQQGIMGLQGPAGLPGIKGDNGPAGPPGLNGVAGAQGPPGPTGAMGATGAVGPAGPAGANGSNGSNGANGQGRLNYVVNSAVVSGTHAAVLNEGIIMKNTAFVEIILDPTPSIGDVVQVVGTSYGTGGWKVTVDPAHTIELTSQSPTGLSTTSGGSIIIAATNYRDVITMIFDGVSTWIIENKIFANGVTPLFT